MGTLGNLQVLCPKSPEITLQKWILSYKMTYGCFFSSSLNVFIQIMFSAQWPKIKKRKKKKIHPGI